MLSSRFLSSLLAPIQTTCLWITWATTVWLRAVTCMSTWVWVCFCVLCLFTYRLNSYVKGHFCSWKPCSSCVHHSTEYMDNMCGADSYSECSTRQKYLWDFALFLSRENMTFQIIVCDVVIKVDSRQFSRCQHCNKRFPIYGGEVFNKLQSKQTEKNLHQFDNMSPTNLL